MFPRPATHAQSLDFSRGARGSTISVHRTYSDPHSYSRSEDRASSSQDSGDEIKVPYVTLTSPETSVIHGRGFPRSSNLPQQKAILEQESLISPHSQSCSSQSGQIGPNFTDDRFSKPDRIKLVSITPLSVAPVERSRDVQFRQLSDVTEGDESQADSKENILACSPDEQIELSTEDVTLKQDPPDWSAAGSSWRQRLYDDDSDFYLRSSTVSSDLEPLKDVPLQLPGETKTVINQEGFSGYDSATSLQSGGDISSDLTDKKRRPFALKRKPLTRDSNVDSGDAIDV